MNPYVKYVLMYDQEILEVNLFIIKLFVLLQIVYGLIINIVMESINVYEKIYYVLIKILSVLMNCFSGYKSGVIFYKLMAVIVVNLSNLLCLLGLLTCCYCFFYYYINQFFIFILNYLYYYYYYAIFYSQFILMFFIYLYKKPNLIL